MLLLAYQTLLSNHAYFGAVALGASILERHFTDSMKRDGPDIICSMDGPPSKERIEGVNILFDQGVEKRPSKESRLQLILLSQQLLQLKQSKKAKPAEKYLGKRPGRTN